MEGSWEEGLNRFNGYLNVLKEALDELDNPPTGEPTYEKWNYVLTRVLGDIPKCKIIFTIFFCYFFNLTLFLVVLCFRDRPTLEYCMPAADLLHEKLLNLIALYQIIAHSASDTLREKLKNLVAELLNSLSKLTHELIEENHNYDTLLNKAGSKVIRIY